LLRLSLRATKTPTDLVNLVYVIKLSE
jgi:hypothetical protein